MHTFENDIGFPNGKKIVYPVGLLYFLYLKIYKLVVSKV